MSEENQWIVFGLFNPVLGGAKKGRVRYREDGITQWIIVWIRFGLVIGFAVIIRGGIVGGKEILELGTEIRGKAGKTEMVLRVCF